MSSVSAERLEQALAGELVSPLVEGLSFVPPAALPGLRGDTAATPASALGRTCEDAHLDFAFVPSWEEWADAATIELAARGVAVLWVVRGVLWPALEAAGVAAGLRATVADPASLAPLMDDALESARIDLARGLARRVAGVVVAEDLAGSGGLLVPPDFACGHVLPRLAMLLSPVGRSRLPAVLHSDGDVRALIGELTRSGFQALHGDCGGEQRIGRTLEVARGEHVALVGGIATAALADPMRAVTVGTAAAAQAAGGGLVLADDGGVTTQGQCAALLGALAAARR
jgi:hypothetical protein